MPLQIKKKKVVIISEQYRNTNEDEGWYSDQSGLSAVKIVNKKISIDEDRTCERGFNWIQIKGIKIYSRYCSINSGTVEYLDFVIRLENRIRTSKVPTFVAWDFNSHFSSWGSPKENKRGEILVDMIAATNLNIRNIGNEPTFVREPSRTPMDIILINLMTHVKNCRILERRVPEPT